MPSRAVVATRRTDGLLRRRLSALRPRDRLLPPPGRREADPLDRRQRPRRRRGGARSFARRGTRPVSCAGYRWATGFWQRSVCTYVEESAALPLTGHSLRTTTLHLGSRSGLHRVPEDLSPLAIICQVARRGRDATPQTGARHPHSVRCQHHDRLLPL